jgi:hypothetical protein
MSKEDLLQNWLPRLWNALKDVRQNNNAAAQETIYELYVEMKQQTLAEKLETFSQITLEDQLSAMALELQAAQKRVSELENGICQRAFEAKQEQGEPVGEPYGYLKLNTGKFVNEVEGLNPMKDKRYLPLYTTPPQSEARGLSQQQRKPLTEEQLIDLWPSLIMHQHTYAFARAIEAAHGIKE